MKKSHEEQLMWILKNLPEDQQETATRNFKTAVESGWNMIDFYQDEGPYHFADLAGIDRNKEFNFIPLQEI